MVHRYGPPGMRLAHTAPMYPKRTRLKTFGYVGFYRYFLTFCTDQRGKVFTNPLVVAFAREQILNAARLRGFAILAYVFMPDHVHLLAEGRREDASMMSFCNLSKQKSAYAHAQKYARRLWQPSYHDRVLRDDEDAWDVIRYIVNNPVRARLVEDFSRYPFLGSGVMTRDELIGELAARENRGWQR